MFQHISRCGLLFQFPPQWHTHTQRFEVSNLLPGRESNLNWKAQNETPNFYRKGSTPSPPPPQKKVLADDNSQFANIHLQARPGWGASTWQIDWVPHVCARWVIIDVAQNILVLVFGCQLRFMCLLCVFASRSPGSTQTHTHTHNLWPAKMMMLFINFSLPLACRSLASY